MKFFSVFNYQRGLVVVGVVVHVEEAAALVELTDTSDRRIKTGESSD